MQVTHIPRFGPRRCKCVDFHAQGPDSVKKHESIIEDEQMKHLLTGAMVACLFLTGCGGENPFVDDDTTGGDIPSDIPDAILNDLGSFTYDPVSQTLTITGLTLEADPITATYNRRPGLDRGGYEAYTSQESSLNRHATAYVRDVNGTRAVVVLTGPQFGTYFGGAAYSRTSSFDPPAVTATTGLASYAGQYVGLFNASGDGGDLLPVDPSVPVELLPTQAAEVTGTILVNADFGDNSVEGRITDRVLVDAPGIVLEDLDLAATAITGDGGFSGNVQQNNQTRGSYAGIFGGAQAGEVAGALFAQNHVSTVTDEEEFGIFVLVQCGQPGADPLCD